MSEQINIADTKNDGEWIFIRFVYLYGEYVLFDLRTFEYSQRTKSSNLKVITSVYETNNVNYVSCE